nr:MAG: hypothetical protein E4H34_01725 [Hyphomicrobiales bacterium]
MRYCFSLENEGRGAMRAVLVFLLLMVSCNLAAAQNTSARLANAPLANSPFVGVWNLIAIERHTPGGEIVPLRRPYSSGQIIYTMGGHFALQFIRPDRPPFAGLEPSAEEALGAFKDYAARYGTFTVDEGKRSLTLHLENSLAPFAPENADMVYSYEFSGNRLEWFTSPRIIDEPGHRFNGTEIYQTYIFERAE